MGNKLKRAIIGAFVYASLFLVGCGAKQTESIDREKSETYEKQDNQDTTSENKNTEDKKKVETRENTDFRQAVWGDGKDLVVKYEGDDYQDQDDTYLYERVVAGYNAYVFFAFEDDGRLHSGGYTFTDTYSGGAQYITQYNIIKTSLTEKYGTPCEDEILPLEDQDLVDMAGESKALEYGYVAYRTRWTTDNSDIMLGMISENYDPAIIIKYNDVNYAFNANTDGL